jgi:hypothetical protein
MNDKSNDFTFILPTNVLLDDDALEDVFQTLFVGISDLDLTLVRPSFQKNPPNEPNKDTNWLSFAIISRDESELSDQLFNAKTGIFTETSVEELNILVSCYGPSSGNLSNLVRNSIRIDQNRLQILRYGIVWVSASKPQNTSYELNSQYQKRWESIYVFRRYLNTTWPINTVETFTATEVPSNPGPSPFQSKME